MSYILGALQKADRERSKKQGLSLDNLSEVPVASGPQSRPGGPILVGLLLAAGIVLVLVLGWKLLPFESPVEPAVPEVAPDSSAEAVPVTAAQGETLPLRASVTGPATLPDQLLIEGIVFVEDRPDRARVFLQGSGYRAGDTFEELMIQSINASSVTLSNGITTRNYPIP